MTPENPSPFACLRPFAEPAAAALVAALAMLPALISPALRVHDEGHFLLAAETIRQGIAGVLAGTPLAVLRDEIHPMGGTLYFTAKPGHVGLLVLAGLLSGGLTVGKAIFLNVLCHAATAGLLAVLARRRYGTSAGAAAGIAYGVVPLTTFFAGSALGVTTAAFFAVLAALLLLDRRATAAFAGGGAATLAVACHYNAAPTIAGILLWGVVAAGWRRTALFAAGGLVSTLALQGATMLADNALGFAYPDFQSWFGELRGALFTHHLHARDLAPETFTDGVRGYGWDAWSYLAGILGLRMSVLLVGGAFAAWQVAASAGVRWRDRVAEAAWPLLPLAIWALYPWKVERSFVLAAPGLAFAFGGAWRTMTARVRDDGARRRTVAMAIAAAALCAGSSAARLRTAPPPFAALIAANEDWIRQAPRGTFNATSFHWKTAPVWKWYLGHERINRGLPSPGADFARFDSPYIAAIDDMAGMPDEGFAAASAAFADAEPFGSTVEHEGTRWYFVARDGQARPLLDPGE